MKTQHNTQASFEYNDSPKDYMKTDSYSKGAHKQMSKNIRIQRNAKRNSWSMD